MKKKTGKSKTGKSMKNLPRKPLNARSAKAVKGGVSENVSLSFSKVNVEYKPQ